MAHSKYESQASAIDAVSTCEVAFQWIEQQTCGGKGLQKCRSQPKLHFRENAEEKAHAGQKNWGVVLNIWGFCDKGQKI